MLGFIVKQIAVGVGIHVITQKVIPKLTDKLEEMKAQEELEAQEEAQAEVKVYTASWK